MRNLFFLFVLMGLYSCRGKQELSIPSSEELRLAMCAAKTTDAAWYKSDNIAPLFDGLGSLQYKISTSNEKCQKYFNQGLILSYAFNHAEAARSFYYATKLDSNCAMCFWGFAYVLGPNYNGGMEPDNYERAYSAIQKALELSSFSTNKEKELIMAMSTRYVKEPVKNRADLDSIYSVNMKQLYIKYPDDPEIAALYAESIMDLHPWDLWDKQGNPKKWTPEIVDILEKLLIKYPDHPGVNHFYIHAVEASFSPERGNRAASLFDNGLIPAAGHLVHMPSHIYIRTGEYHKGSMANLNAIKIDSQYVSSCHAQGAYPLAYYPHNYHFLAATATMEGKEEWAIMAAQKVSEHADLELMKDPVWGTLQQYYVIPYFVKIKFGKWDEILKMNNANKELKYPEAIRHYARGWAFLGKSDLENAKKECDTLELMVKDTSLKEITIWYINSVASVVDIASKLLKAEILASESLYDESIRLLKEAVDEEDKLNYNEPPDWFFSIRHNLGAVQIEAGKYDDAIETYKKDLNWWPRNGWALHGLKFAYQKKNDQRALALIEKELRTTWANADINLLGSRIK
jgi:tetratricopeptide (TPR) repeat protein